MPRLADHLRRLPPIRWIQLVVIGVTLVVFAPLFDATWLNWDDTANFTQNPSWRGLSPEHLRWMWTGTLLGHYQPLTWMSFGLEYPFWGEDAGGYHVVSVAAHAVAAALFVALLGRLLPTAGNFGWMAGGLFFAVHPLRVETVAWLSDRGTILALLFALLSVHAWLDEVVSARPGRSRAVAFFVASLACKLHAAPLPFVLLILDRVPLGRGLSLRRSLMEKVPFFVAALAGLAVGLAAKSLDGGMRSLAEHPLRDRLQATTIALSVYPGLLVAPVGLTPIRATSYFAGFPVGLSLAALLLTGVAAVGLSRRWPGIGAACVAFVILVLPMAGLLQSGIQVVADRYTYVAGLPVAVLLAAGAGRLGSTAPRLLLATYLVALGWGANRYAAVWTDSITLWSHAVALDPVGSVPVTNLAMALEEAGHPEQAAPLWEEAFRRRPHGETAYNFGVKLSQAGQMERALAVLSRVGPDEDRAAEAACVRGALRASLGDREAGVAELLVGAAQGRCGPAERQVLVHTLEALGRGDEADRWR